MSDHSSRGTYPPLDVLKPVADGVFVVDSGPHRVMGLPLPVRMTVVRLASGDLWLHSPTRPTERLKRELESHGRVRHLVAPNVGHWSYLQQWQRAYRGAVTWAAPGLRTRAPVRKAGVRLDYDLRDLPPVEWAGEIEQVIVPGAKFTEVVFCHRPSRTVLLTDLIVNIEPEMVPAIVRPAARLAGVLAPDGSTPLYLRLAIGMKRAAAAEAVRRILDWEPERAVISHGTWFEAGATQELRRRFAWLQA